MEDKSGRDSPVFRHSRKLFVRPDNSPMFFCMRPCSERSRIKPMIEHGGGRISNVEDKDCIRLAEKGSIVYRKNIVSCEFIDKCVEKNRLLDVEKFYLNMTSKQDSESDEDFSRKPLPKAPIQLNLKRREYTYNEQQKIVTYVCKKKLFEYLKGNMMWKEMEANNIVQQRTWQSLKEHFRKKIINKLSSFQINEEDRRRLLEAMGKLPSPKKYFCGSPSQKFKEKEREEESDSSENLDQESPQPGPSGVVKRLPKASLNLLNTSPGPSNDPKRFHTNTHVNKSPKRPNRVVMIYSSSDGDESSNSANNSPKSRKKLVRFDDSKSGVERTFFNNSPKSRKRIAIIDDSDDDVELTSVNNSAKSRKLVMTDDDERDNEGFTNLSDLIESDSEPNSPISNRNTLKLSISCSFSSSNDEDIFMQRNDRTAHTADVEKDVCDVNSNSEQTAQSVNSHLKTGNCEEHAELLSSESLFPSFEPENDVDGNDYQLEVNATQVPIVYPPQEAEELMYDVVEEVVNSVVPETAVESVPFAEPVDPLLNVSRRELKISCARKYAERGNSVLSEEEFIMHLDGFSKRDINVILKQTNVNSFRINDDFPSTSSDESLNDDSECSMYLY